VTVPTFSSYQPPGVYVSDVTGPIVTTTGVFPQILTLVGPGLGYRTAVQTFQIFAGTGAILNFTGVFTTAQAGPPAIAAPVMTVTGSSTILAQGTDYSFTVTPDPSGNAALAVTSVFRVGTSTSIADGAQVTITYNYADVTYYQPQLFTNFPAVTNAYGQPLVAAAPTQANVSQVANPLSYAAQTAFGAGTTRSSRAPATRRTAPWSSSCSPRTPSWLPSTTRPWWSRSSPTTWAASRAAPACPSTP